jgi:hypothetical protein
LNSGIACYHSVQNILSYLLCRKVIVGLYKAVILPVALFGYETISLTLKEATDGAAQENIWAEEKPKCQEVGK